MFHDSQTVIALEPANRFSPPQTNSQSSRRAGQNGWLGQAIARHGPELWDRLVSSLPADQANALRQQLEAFVYELELDEIDDD